VEPGVVALVLPLVPEVAVLVLVRARAQPRGRVLAAESPALEEEAARAPADPLDFQ